MVYRCTFILLLLLLLLHQRLFQFYGNLSPIASPNNSLNATILLRSLESTESLESAYSLESTEFLESHQSPRTSLKSRTADLTVMILVGISCFLFRCYLYLRMPLGQLYLHTTLSKCHLPIMEWNGAEQNMHMLHRHV